jgi:DNA-binding IclR family transcriptional regulator
MAGLPEDERVPLYKELANAEEKRWPELLKKLKQALSEFEKTGYVVNKGCLHPQINAVAVPVSSADGSVLLSLSAGGISQVFDDAKLKAVGTELKQFARRLVPALAKQ